MKVNLDEINEELQSQLEKAGLNRAGKAKSELQSKEELAKKLKLQIKERQEKERIERMKNMRKGIDTLD